MKAFAAPLAALTLAACSDPAYAGSTSGAAGTLDVTPVDPPTSAQYPHFVCYSGCSSAGVTAATHVQSAALAANLVAKNAAGTLYTFEAIADATLNGAAWYIIIYDATSAPADGAVTPAKCYYVPSGQSTFGGTFGPAGTAFATGITIGVSTTGCFSKTASTHAFIAADIQ